VTKRCRKMKRIQQARLGSMGRMRDTVWQCGDIDWRRGGIEERKGGDDVSWADVNLTGPENKENPHG
jgi:hypothetical protein